MVSLDGHEKEPVSLGSLLHQNQILQLLLPWLPQLSWFSVQSYLLINLALVLLVLASLLTLLFVYAPVNIGME